MFCKTLQLIIFTMDAMDFLSLTYRYDLTILIQTSLLSRITHSELVVPTVLKIGVWSCLRRSVFGHTVGCVLRLCTLAMEARQGSSLED